MVKPRRPRALVFTAAIFLLCFAVLSPFPKIFGGLNAAHVGRLFSFSLPTGRSPMDCPAPAPFADDPGPKVAIIGAAGYVGAALHKHLRESGYKNVRGFDRNMRASKFEDVAHCSGNGLQDKYLRQFDVVIYLGGFTGRKACDAHTADEVHRENVQDVVRFAQRMHANQLLVFAATSAVAEGSGAPKHLFRETDVPDQAVMDAYTLSMYRREKVLHALAAEEDYRGPSLVALRFGTVLGVSPSQKVEYVHVGMLRSALLEGRITVKHPETWRAFLWIPDQVRAMEKIISNWDGHFLASGDRFHLFHLSSFNARIGQSANEVAAAVHVPQTVLEHDPLEDSPGFLLDNAKISSQFKLSFEGTPQTVVADLLAHKDHIIMGREALDQEQHVHDYVPCRVCGSHNMMEVLDLGMQPLANDFRPTVEDSHQCERHPLRLMRCRKCNHAQLSTMVDRKPLFTNYTYRSATSRTLDDYFTWLADKVEEETGTAGTSGPKKVLELACNDGTQLNHFKRLGWETYGVDPATNLVPYAREQGHTVWNEMWGASHADKYTGMPEEFDAILGQNVLAHVPNPVDFLAGCVERMNARTRLYMQTSQCDMFADGQFDTVYHEHISFFSPRSFRQLAEEVGLHVVHWEITPIHGGSCLVTMMKKVDAADDTLPAALEKEEHRGQLEDTYFLRYRAQALATRDWLNRVLEGMEAQGHDIVGYGAAAKGMVLLHFLLAQEPNFALKYVVDDAPLKQDLYCPGTSIPVKPTSELALHDTTKPLTIIVFSWNFWAEIRQRIVEALTKAPNPHKVVWVVLPFPRQEVLVLRGADLQEMETLQTNPYRAPQGPFPRPPKVAMVTHFYNEALLMPYFIQHHAGMFDSVVLIDSNSDDASRTIIAEYAPSTWEVVESAAEPGVFDAVEVDKEVVGQEGRFPDLWRIALTTTEFLVHPDLVGELKAKERADPDSRTLHFPALRFVGDDSEQLQRFPSLLGQRSQVLQNDWTGQYSRYIHRFSPDLGMYYDLGRHDLLIKEKTTLAEHGFIAKWAFTPWPESIDRKMQIGKRIPAEHVRSRMGFQHMLKDEAELEQLKTDAVAHYGVADLRYVCGLSSNATWHQAATAWYQTTGADTVYKEAEDFCSGHPQGGRRRGF